MQFSTIISKLFIIFSIIVCIVFTNIFGLVFDILPDIITNAYAVENTPTIKQNNNNVNNDNLNQNNDYKQVSLDDIGTGTLLFQQANNNQFLQAPQLKTQVEIEINGIVANVKVKQKFTNSSNYWQHGVYAFPLPDNAAINQLNMRVANRVIVGQVQEIKQAIKTFNKAKKAGKKAALITQFRPNLFTTNIANIPPNEVIEVEISYFQQIDYQAGQFSLVFPMAITPRYQPKAGQAAQASTPLPELIFQAQAAAQAELKTITSAEKNSTISLSDKQLNTAQRQGQSIDLTVELFSGAVLAQVNSINHSLISTQKEEGHYSLKLINQAIKKDFKLIWQYKAQTLPQVLNFQQQYQHKKYGLLMVLPGLSALAKNKVTTMRELTFVLDTSGSMAGDSLAQAKQAFSYALSSLTEHDSFQLIAFNSYPTKLFQAPVLANETNKQQAKRFVSALTASGGTEIKAALDLVLNEQGNKNEKLQQIVFLTDGAVGNEAEIFSEIANKIGSKRLFTVGLGTAPNRYFMKKAAEIGRGSYQFISNHNELVHEMDQLFTKLSQPILTDLSLSLNNVKRQSKTGIKNILKTTPEPIPDVYANEPLFLSYQVTGEQSDSLLSGIYQGKTWSVNIDTDQQQSVDKNTTNKARNSVEQGEKSRSNKREFVIPEPTWQQSIPPLATLWARRKIADHYRQLMLYKDTEAKANIIELALKYHLVTPFTSLVAVEEAVTRPNNKTAQTKKLTNRLPAGQKLPATALNWQWQFNGAICLLLMSAISLLLLPSRARADERE